MANFAYYNGSFEPYERLRIPLTDRALYFGDGVYDVMLARRGRVYQHTEHIERLTGNCRALHIPFKETERELLSVIHRLTDLSSLCDAVIYIQVSRRSERRMHEIDGVEYNLLITVSPYHGYESKEVTAITLPDLRHGTCNLKTLNLLHSVLAIEEARRSGADCAILHRDGKVTEEARSNIAIINSGRLITHPCDCRILPGIMRSNVLRKSSELGIPIEERPFSIEELFGAEEIFVSSTTKFIYRVVEINGKDVGGRASAIYFELRKHMIMEFLHETD